VDSQPSCALRAVGARRAAAAIVPPQQVRKNRSFVGAPDGA